MVSRCEYYRYYTSIQWIGRRKDKTNHMDHQGLRDPQDPLRYSRQVLVMLVVAIKQNESIGNRMSISIAKCEETKCQPDSEREGKGQ